MKKLFAIIAIPDGWGKFENDTTNNSIRYL